MQFSDLLTKRHLVHILMNRIFVTVIFGVNVIFIICFLKLSVGRHNNNTVKIHKCRPLSGNPAFFRPSVRLNVCLLS